MAVPGVEKIVPAGMGMSRLVPLLEEAVQEEINLNNNNPALKAKGSMVTSPTASGPGLGGAARPGQGGAEGVIAGIDMESDEIPEGEIRFEFTEHELVNEVSGEHYQSVDRQSASSFPPCSLLLLPLSNVYLTLFLTMFIHQFCTFPPLSILHFRSGSWRVNHPLPPNASLSKPCWTRNHDGTPCSPPIVLWNSKKASVGSVCNLTLPLLNIFVSHFWGIMDILVSWQCSKYVFYDVKNLTQRFLPILKTSIPLKWGHLCLDRFVKMLLYLVLMDCLLVCPYLRFFFFTTSSFFFFPPPSCNILVIG